MSQETTRLLEGRINADDLVFQGVPSQRSQLIKRLRGPGSRVSDTVAFLIRNNKCLRLGPAVPM